MGELPSSIPVFADSAGAVQFGNAAESVFPYSVTHGRGRPAGEPADGVVIVDDMTDTGSNKNRECVGQGVANFVTGFLWGAHGRLRDDRPVGHQRDLRRPRTRLSDVFRRRAFLLFLIVVLGDWVKQIPMPALVAVMIMVSISTFNWSSIVNLRSHPLSLQCRDAGDASSIVVATGDLLDGRSHRGACSAACSSRRKVARLLGVARSVCRRTMQITYVVHRSGVLCLVQPVSPTRSTIRTCRCGCVIDVSGAHFWDITAIAALDDIVSQTAPPWRRRRCGRAERSQRDHGRAVRHPSQAGSVTKSGALNLRGPVLRRIWQRIPEFPDTPNPLRLSPIRCNMSGNRDCNWRNDGCSR